MTFIAHAFQVRSDLPIPEWLFGWAAAIVLLVSFVALAALWPEPRLQTQGWRNLPGAVGRLAAGRAGSRAVGAAAAYAFGFFAVEVLANGGADWAVYALVPIAVAYGVLVPRPVDKACGAAGVFLLGMVVWSGLEGVDNPTANFAPVLVFVIVMNGMVAASVVFGDVFRAFNPWRAIGRLVAWAATTAARTDMPAPLDYPKWLGRWPAAAGLLLIAAQEFVFEGEGTLPRSVAIATLAYTAVTFVAMALFGVERWSERGEALSVYFNLFSRISPLEVRDGRLGLRRPLSGLPQLAEIPGTVPLLAVMVGSVTFDGAAEAPIWTGISPDMSDFFQDLGVSPQWSFYVTFAIGLAAAVLFVYGFYRLGIAGARSVGGKLSADRLANTFVHTLVPIALAYVTAHYMTQFLFQGQSIVFLASDPLGDGSDIFGTADKEIDYGVIGATATWYWQVGFVVLGHVLALTLAHDRAIAIYDQARLAVRSQYWMLVIMVGFTSLALWLLSQANV